MQAAPRAPDAVSLLLFASAVTLGGANFLAVRFSNMELDPFWGAGLRFAVAAAIFVAIAAAMRLPLPRGPELRRAALLGVLSFTLFYALMYWALLQVTAGVATVVMAMVPLVTLLLATAQGQERLRARAVLGATLALAGIGWMTFGPGDVVLPIAALLAMIAAAGSASQGIIVAKGISYCHPVMVNAVSMSVGAPLLIVLSAATGESWGLPRQTEPIVALLYLVTLGSVGLFMSVLSVVRRWTASASSYIFVLFPVATMALEAWIAGVPIEVHAAIGALLVMSGVWFGALAPAARSGATPPAAERA